MEAKRAPAARMFAPAVIDPVAVPPTSPASPASSELATIEINIGSATVCIRGAVDAKTLALVLKALRSLG